MPNTYLILIEFVLVLRNLGWNKELMIST